MDLNAPPLGDGQTWQAAFTSIQQGIGAASAGDQVWVKGGVGRAEASTFSIHSATISNNRIVNNGTGTAMFGGGIWLYQSSASTISGNTISDNSAQYGGGISFHHSSPTISSNVITGNAATHGGGVNFETLSYPIIRENWILNNSAVGNGGGISCHNQPRPVISNNVLAGNAAALGAAFSLYHTTATVANNTIAYNSATTHGGGLYCWSIVAPDSQVRVANNIIAFNSDGAFAEPDCTLQIDYNDVHGNTGGNYLGNAMPGANDIAADPLLDANLHLRCNSGAIDQNVDQNVVPPHDIDMDARPRDGNGGDSQTEFDMGADEFLWAKSERGYCSDGVDNDCDGMTDCLDSNCNNAPECN